MKLFFPDQPRPEVKTFSPEATAWRMTSGWGGRSWETCIFQRFCFSFTLSGLFILLLISNMTFYCFCSVKVGLFQIVQTVELISLYVETWASNFCFLFFSLSFSAPPLFFDIVIWSQYCWCTSLDRQSNREQAWPSGKQISQHPFFRNFWEENKNDSLSLYIFYFYLL